MPWFRAQTQGAHGGYAPCYGYWGRGAPRRVSGEALGRERA